MEEVRVAYEILRALGLRSRGIDLHVCPTCGRTGIDLVTVADRVRRELADVVDPLKVVLMGCVVNGLGEVQEADIGLVASQQQGTIYIEGKPVLISVPEEQLAKEIVRTARGYLRRRRRTDD